MDSCRGSAGQADDKHKAIFNQFQLHDEHCCLQRAAQGSVFHESWLINQWFYAEVDFNSGPFQIQATHRSCLVRCIKPQSNHICEY